MNLGNNSYSSFGFGGFQANYALGGANMSGGAVFAGMSMPDNGNFAPPLWGGPDANLANCGSGCGEEVMSQDFMGLLGALLEEFSAEEPGEKPSGDQPAEGSLAEQRGGRGGDTQNINGSAGDDTTLQRGRQGNDFQNAKGNDGNDFITQRGGKGLNTQRAQGGAGDDVIHQRGVGRNTSLAEGGEGDDQFIYDLNGKRANASLKGGEGFDSATVNAGKKNVTVVGADGEVLFKKGNGGSVIRVDSVEDLKVVGAKGKLLFDSNDPEAAGGSSGAGGGNGGGQGVPRGRRQAQA